MVWSKSVGQQEVRRDWLGLQGTGTSFLLPYTLSYLARMPRIAEWPLDHAHRRRKPAEPGDEINWICNDDSSSGDRGEPVNHLGNLDTPGLPHQEIRNSEILSAQSSCSEEVLLSRGLKRLSVDPRTQMSLKEEIVNCHRFPSWDWSVNQPGFSAVQPSLHNLPLLFKKHCPAGCINFQASEQQKASKHWFQRSSL